MQINLPEKVRGALYIFTGVGSVVVTYLGATEIISTPEMALWTGFTAFIATLAQFNLGSPKDQVKP